MIMLSTTTVTHQPTCYLYHHLQVRERTGCFTLTVLLLPEFCVSSSRFMVWSTVCDYGNSWSYAFTL